MEECGILSCVEMMHGNIAATECTNQINRIIMLSFVNKIFASDKYVLHTVACQNFTEGCEIMF